MSSVCVACNVTSMQLSIYSLHLENMCMCIVCWCVVYVRVRRERESEREESQLIEGEMGREEGTTEKDTRIIRRGRPIHSMYGRVKEHLLPGINVIRSAHICTCVTCGMIGYGRWGRYLVVSHMCAYSSLMPHVRRMEHVRFILSYHKTNLG